MIELYFNDANLLPENREEEQYAEAALNNLLAGKMADTGMCIMPCFYDAPLHKGLLYHLDDGTTLRIRPILNEAGEPELLIRCVTEETVEEMQEAEHAHDHSKEVSTFEDHEVQDRSLSDWEGSWQSDLLSERLQNGHYQY